MNKSTLVSAIVAAVVLMATSAQGQVYNGVPIDFEMGYSIEPGGTITVVDGELTDGHISVQGEYPYTFGAEVVVGNHSHFDGANVTTDEISIAAYIQESVFFLSEYIDGCPADDLCSALLRWSPEANKVEFSHRGFVLGGNNPAIPDFLFDVAVSVPLTETAVIAVASQSVPGPTAGCLVAMALLCVTGLRRKQSRKRGFQPSFEASVHSRKHSCESNER